ncbi:MAG TPA: hypothetical protein VEG27_11300 [Usitatibacter sp.]|nr:hypothetical protein [Usitatibacter sp.]
MRAGAATVRAILCASRTVLAKLRLPMCRSTCACAARQRGIAAANARRPFAVEEASFTRPSAPARKATSPSRASTAMLRLTVALSITRKPATSRRATGSAATTHQSTASWLTVRPAGAR